ncbi:hypothetical protein [Paenibacillus cremeus]|uniref:hypothetical protein n=1 Tax=Paenibacillus cremeus TaxID=2163881 RepID=UPI001646D9CB|nr:hypothetical protein [Paenibacillus cremeus]
MEPKESLSNFKELIHSIPEEKFDDVLSELATLLGKYSLEDQLKALEQLRELRSHN